MAQSSDTNTNANTIGILLATHMPLIGAIETYEVLALTQRLRGRNIARHGSRSG